MRYNDGMYQSYSKGGNEKWSNSGLVLEVEPTALSNNLNTSKRKVKGDSKVVSLNNYYLICRLLKWEKPLEESDKGMQFRIWLGSY